jgi:hypothetical protein
VPPVGMRPLRPEQLARTIEASTGFRWWVNPDLPRCENGGNEGSSCWGKVDLMTSDLFGFRAMAGGVNGFQITVPTHTFTPPRELVTERFVAEAAGYAVARDFETLNAADRRLFHFVDESTTDPDAVRAQIAWLYVPTQTRRLDPDDAEVGAIYDLWLAKLERSGSARDAWALALTALFLDPLAVTY